MTQLFQRFRSSPSTCVPQHSAPIFILVLLLGVLVGCDAVSVQSYESSSNDAESAERTTSFVKADLLFDAIELSEGETFSIDLIDDQFAKYVARITHTEASSGNQIISASFNSVDPAAVTLRCRNQQKVVEQKDFSQRFGRLLKTTNTKVAKSDDEPDSYHYYTEDGTTIVEVDYEESESTDGGTTVQFHPSGEVVGCTHLGFVLEGVTTAISADNIRFGGAIQDPTFRERTFK